MCFSGFGGGKPSVPDAPAVDPAPTRDQAMAAIRAMIDDEDAGKPENVLKAAAAERENLQKRQGLYGNVKSSMAGDDFYYAKFSRPTERVKMGKKRKIAYLQPGARDEGGVKAKANMRYN